MKKVVYIYCMICLSCVLSACGDNDSKQDVVSDGDQSAETSVNKGTEGEDKDTDSNSAAQEGGTGGSENETPETPEGETQQTPSDHGDGSGTSGPSDEKTDGDGTDPGNGEGDDKTPESGDGGSTGETGETPNKPEETAETAIGAVCEESSFGEQCHGELPVYCDEEEGVTSIYESGCDVEGYICGLTEDGYSECFEPCTKEGDTRVYCAEDNLYNGTVVMDECVSIGYGRLGYISSYKKCNGACVDGACAYDYSHIEELGTVCDNDNYKRHCTSNVALYCSNSKVMIYQDCSLEEQYTKCGETMESSGVTAACHEPCTEVGTKVTRCSSSGSVRYDFECGEIGSGGLGYIVKDWEICSCIHDVCEE